MFIRIVGGPTPPEFSDAWEGWSGMVLPAVPFKDLPHEGKRESYCLHRTYLYPAKARDDDWAVPAEAAFQVIEPDDDDIDVSDTIWHAWMRSHPGLNSLGVYLIFPREVCELIPEAV